MDESKLESVIKRFDECVKEAEALRTIARATELQAEAVESLKELYSSLTAKKAEFVDSQDEDSANIVLGFQCATQSLALELEMYILLKIDRPGDAWDTLVAAQEASLAAMRAHDRFAYIANLYNFQLSIEKHLFPPQAFLSAGIIVKEAVCSICRSDYRKCDHILYRPYMGEFCTVTITEAGLDHGSIVEEPEDKRCRIETFTENGITRDKMTWRVKENSNDDGISISGVLISNHNSN